MELISTTKLYSSTRRGKRSINKLKWGGSNVLSGINIESSGKCSAEDGSVPWRMEQKSKLQSNSESYDLQSLCGCKALGRCCWLISHITFTFTGTANSLVSPPPYLWVQLTWLPAINGMDSLHLLPSMTTRLVITH
jgi:hypothetical protein